MRSLHLLAWRTARTHWLRSLSSILAVALGTSTIVAADVTGSAIRNAGQKIAGSQGTVAFAGDFLNIGLSLMGWVILVAAGFLIFNAFGMAVTQRRQEIGVLRSLGMTRRQVMGLVLVEALVIGLAGTLLGLGTGPLLGHGVLNLLVRLVGVARGRAGVQAAGLFQAIGAGLGITLLATLIPAWRAAATTPLTALRSEAASGTEENHTRWALVGLIVIVSLAAFLVLKPPARTSLAPPWDMALTGLLTGAWLTGLALLLPFLVSIASDGFRQLNRSCSAVRRLTADNLARARGRVLLTIITLVIALFTITSVTGITTFSFQVVTTEIVAQYDIEWVVAPIPISEDGVAVNWELVSRWDLATWILSPGFLADLSALVQDRAHLIHVPQVEIPELAILPGLPVFVADPAELSQSGLFTFAEGDWSTARPVMESGCGLLLMPRMARKHNAGLNDKISLQGVNGPVECTVAGLGTSSFMGTSIVSMAAGPEFGLEPNHYFVVIVLPQPGVNRQALHSDLKALLDQNPGHALIEVDPFFDNIAEMVGSLQVLLNSMLLLAVLAATLGVINTTMISVSERQPELGLLRAVGATRRQVTAIVTGEAALMGLVGGAVGLIAGIGLTAIFIAVNGGNIWGFQDLPLWTATWTSIRPALLNGLIGLLAAPALCAGAAWLPVRVLLRQGTIDLLRTE
jgi:putative ABC transport system permease protein